MDFITGTVLLALSLCLGMLGSVEIGYRKGKQDLQKDPDNKIEGLGTVDSSVFGLLGLILAFTFTGALTRFEQRQQLIVQEANAIGTAYLRLDLLPSEDQQKLRPLYKQYVAKRINLYENIEDKSLREQIYKETVSLQNQIWQIANQSVSKEKHPAIMSLVLDSTNTMIDSAGERIQASLIHPPSIVYAFLFLLAIVSALLIGYDMASNTKLYYLHIFLFCFLVSAIVYLILDLEYPRQGLLQINKDSDRVMTEVLKSMP